MDDKYFKCLFRWYCTIPKVASYSHRFYFVWTVKKFQIFLVYFDKKSALVTHRFSKNKLCSHTRQKNIWNQKRSSLSCTHSFYLTHVNYLCCLSSIQLTTPCDPRDTSTFCNVIAAYKKLWPLAIFPRDGRSARKRYAVNGRACGLAGPLRPVTRDFMPIFIKINLTRWLNQSPPAIAFLFYCY